MMAPASRKCVGALSVVLMSWLLTSACCTSAVYIPIRRICSSKPKYEMRVYGCITPTTSVGHCVSPRLRGWDWWLPRRLCWRCPAPIPWDLWRGDCPSWLHPLVRLHRWQWNSATPNHRFCPGFGRPPMLVSRWRSIICRSPEISARGAPSSPPVSSPRRASGTCRHGATWPMTSGCSGWTGLLSCVPPGWPAPNRQLRRHRHCSNGPGRPARPRCA